MVRFVDVKRLLLLLPPLVDSRRPLLGSLCYWRWGGIELASGQRDSCDSS